ncbi:alpha/beta hydrolase superfamily protein [Capsaspora owczarzaki ATCC 30864]|uniref:Alpha/beta hydrolase superfamily protein n=1 Tax=Capsaspora owczarzaki (strain ATCC 30864) TaxID=595528 RepID=A0A0D2X0P0_CAPO3|nr:alpha/beta hydrolase superfamily protein [Capsaspora owczarzaki ATCC 30864]
MLGTRLLNTRPLITLPGAHSSTAAVCSTSATAALQSPSDMHSAHVASRRRQQQRSMSASAADRVGLLRSLAHPHPASLPQAPLTPASHLAARRSISSSAAASSSSFNAATKSPAPPPSRSGAAVSDSAAAAAAAAATANATATAGTSSSQTSDVPYEAYRVVAADGYPLAVRLFRPQQQSPKAVILVNSATACSQGYYANFAAYMAGLGNAVVTYDYRGIGESRPPNNASLGNFAATMRDWAFLDYPAVLALIDEQLYPRGSGEAPASTLPIFIVGHSFGGQLVGMLHPELYVSRVRGAVLVAAQSGFVNHWSGMSWLVRRVQWWMIPWLVRFAGYVPGAAGIGEDLPGGVALEWASWCLTPGYATGKYPSKLVNFAAFSAPVLSVEAPDDDFAPKKAVDELLSWYSNTRVTRWLLNKKAFPGQSIGHFGFFRKRVGGQTIWPAMEAWMAQSLSTSAPIDAWTRAPTEPDVHQLGAVVQNPSRSTELSPRVSGPVFKTIPAAGNLKSKL